VRLYRVEFSHSLGQFPPPNFATAMEELARIPDMGEARYGRGTPGDGCTPATGRQRWECDLKAADPLTGEISVHLNHPNFSGTLATGGGLLFLALLDGTVAAFDDAALDELWKINVGLGFSAPPMTFEVNGKPHLPSPRDSGINLTTRISYQFWFRRFLGRRRAFHSNDYVRGSWPMTS
jgi:hypothetical protein